MTRPDIANLHDEAEPGAPHLRSDAERNYERILQAAGELLAHDPTATIGQIAAAARVGRATVYRHFATRGELIDAARRRPAAVELAPWSGAASTPALVDILNGVPPHLVGEQIVAEAQRIAGVSSVALYLVDIDGSRLLRFAGSRAFPAELAGPLAVGPELAPEGIAALRRHIDAELPNTLVAPLHVRGRALGLLLAADATPGSLSELARTAAVAIDVAAAYTDVFAMARRRKTTQAAAEIQQMLLPPRIVRMTGATLAGNVLPGYDVGGDWFDYAENADGAWVGVGDASGMGPAAASLSALALGAFRAARHDDAELEETVRRMDGAVHAVARGGADVTAIIGRWHGPSSTFAWITCGHPPPAVIDGRGRLERLEGAVAALGAGADGRAQRRRLRPGDRLVLSCDGILERRRKDGAAFGFDGLRRAVDSVRGASAAVTVHAIEQAVRGASPERLRDDATLVVLVPALPGAAAP